MLPFIGIATGIFGTVANAAKRLFSGEAKQARQERQELKKEAKETAKKAKETAKQLITGGAKGGAAVGNLLNESWNWLKKNWLYVVIVAGAIFIIRIMFFGKRRRSSIRRRRRPGGIISRIRRGKGSLAMKRKMARVRAARKRKK